MKFEDIKVGDRLIFVADYCDYSGPLNGDVNCCFRESWHHFEAVVIFKTIDTFYIVLEQDANRYIFWNEEAHLFERRP